jgi:ABC-type antimicrobial peptide transport system permease subunit
MRPTSFNDWINFNLITQRLAAACVGILGGLGLLLAIMGLSGTVAYSVSERKREFGIRAALGAERSMLVNMVLRQTSRTTALGIVIGTLMGIGATILLRSQFYGIGVVEWTVLLTVASATLIVSIVVAYLSARPWLTIDPMEAVRHI